MTAASARKNILFIYLADCRAEGVEQFFAPRRRRLLDHPLEPVIGLAAGETRWRMMTTALLHHRRGLSEQQLALVLGADRGLAEIRIDLLGERVGAYRGRPLADGLKPALEMRKVVDVLALVLVRHHPGIARHVRDRIIAGDEFAIGEPLVEHAIETIGLVHIAVDRVFDFLLGVVAEVMVLARHRPEPAHLPERPLQGVVTAVDIGGKKLSGLLGEIEQHRAGFEDRDRLAAAFRLVIDHRGNAVVRRDRQKLRLELIALADIDRENLVSQPGLFEKHRDLVAVRRGPVVQIDHGAFPDEWRGIAKWMRMHECRHPARMSQWHPAADIAKVMTRDATPTGGVAPAEKIPGGCEPVHSRFCEPVVLLNSRNRRGLDMNYDGFQIETFEAG